MTANDSAARQPKNAIVILLNSLNRHRSVRVIGCATIPPKRRTLPVPLKRSGQLKNCAPH